MAQQDLIVYRSYNYKGVNVIVKLDFLEGTASIVERDEISSSVDFRPKDWIFAERQVEYMNGWRLIFHAMDYAIVEAKKELEALKKKKLDKFIEFQIALGKVKEEDVKNAKSNNRKSSK